MKRSLRTRLSIILAMVMLLGYAITAFGGSGTTGITSEKGVEPVVYKDNRPPEHKSPFVKLDTGKMGTYQLLKNDEIQVEIYKTNEGNYQGVTAVHWESTIAISYVWVKGGNCGSLYVYGSDVKEDSGLYAPINPETSKPYGVSHVTFYYDDESPGEPPECGSVTVTKVDDSNNHTLTGWEFILYKETSSDVYVQADEPKTTDENGQASWDSLEPGTYKVIETEQSGWEPVDPESGGFEFELAAGTQETVEFRNKQEPEQILGSISGMKFHDKNANGKRDPGEKGLNGWTIELYTDANAQVSIALAASDIELVARVETSDGGEFHFNDLPLGRYYLKEAMTSKQSQEYEQTVPKSNWFTIELTEATKDVEDVLFGNKQKRTPPVEDPEEPEEPKEPEKPEEPEEPPVDEPPTEEPPVEEPPVEETPVDEPDTEIIEDPEIPLAELPTTGGIPPMVNYGIGMLLTVTGVAIKRRRKP